MALQLTYQEEVESVGTASCGFSMEGGRAVSRYLIENVAVADLQTAVTEILGMVNTDPSANGKLNRTPPLAHPIYPFLFANAIQSIRGVGVTPSQMQEAADPQLDCPPFPNFTLYTDYTIDVEFTPRPYPVMSDNNIPVSSITWKDWDGSSKSNQIANEWYRWCDFTITPQNQSVTQQLGQMAFNSTDSGVNGNGFPASIRMFLPDQLIKFTWYNVPYRYYSSANSFINSCPSGAPSFVGRVNQFAWGLAASGQSGNWPAGSLLYLGCQPVRYTPPIQKEDQVYPGVFSSEKLCNYEFSFLYTNRSTPAGPSSSPSNGNYIVGGHNLLPYPTKKNFYYATVDGSSSGIPSFYSFPFELLFTDPDA